jgi:ubiquinone/menaquinone biosynthesis C-methylase UbiE
VKQRFEIRALNDAQAAVHDAIARFPFYQTLLAELLDALAPSPGGRYLDLGCGTGNLAVAARARGVDLVGVDLSAAMLIEAWRKGCELIMADLHQLPLSSESVDGALSVNALWQLDHPADFIGELRRVLRPGGRLVLCTPRVDDAPDAQRFDAAIMADMLRDPSLAGDRALLERLREYGRVNLEIVRLRPGAFYDEERLRALLEGFEVDEVREAYAGQSWLLRARRGR